MWGRMCMVLCWLKTVPSPREKHARGCGTGPRSLTVPPLLDANGEAEQHRRDRRTRTHPVNTRSPSTRTREKQEGNMSTLRVLLELLFPRGLRKRQQFLSASHGLQQQLMGESLINSSCLRTAITEGNLGEACP